ncbi:hypothetical protein P1X15_29885 [Runella sp. MFBS21]|uniref:hypothetical protein n=1 Tax=Runella sp. MFBS21 TaxID=3034018 RepID=UPI0023FA0D0E|nr:hypothetical protein [Runella sp. MFBS21]MDF7821864.1 hypothetical protein [Runella sp. MFBS21]
MNQYFQKNLLEYYKVFVGGCIASVALMTLVTIYVVNSSYEKVKKANRDTYVFSANGASIHVFIPQQNGRTTKTAKTL